MTTTRDIVIYAGEAFTLSLPYSGATGRGQRTHIRTADAAATVVQILTHNGDANARVIYNDSTQMLDYTIGASVSALWLVGANRVEWVYDSEDHDLSDADDVVIPYRGKVIVYGNRTRAEDVTPSPQMPSGDGRYVRFDTDAQGLSDAQKLAARTNIGAGGGGGGSGDVVGPASATDGALAVFDGTTGKLLADGPVTGAAVAAHMANSAGEHGITALGENIIQSNTQDEARGALGLGALSTVTPGTGIATALAVNVGSNGAPVIQGGALGTPSSGDLSNVSGLPPSGIANAGATLGQVITWSGAAWVPETPSGGATPGGSGAEPQYRIDGTTFGGMAGVAWDDTNRCETRTGATVTTSNPVQSFTQTWNNAAVAFTGWLFNLTNTASAATSRILDLQVAGTSLNHFPRDGGIRVGGMATGLAGYATYAQDGGGNPQIFRGASPVVNFAAGCQVGNTGYFGFASAFAPSEGGQDVSLYRDASGVLAQRRTTSAQTFRVYGTWTDASNYVRASLAATSTAVTLTAETAGTGADDVPLTVTAGGVAHVISGSPLRLPSFTVAALPSAATAAAMIYVSNESGGAVLAFSDGTNWRRVTDRAIVS